MDPSIVILQLSAPLLAKLGDLAITSVRQLYGRLQAEKQSLQTYLKLSDADFAELSGKVERVVRQECPEDLAPKSHPAVNKRGVAVHRLRDL